MHGPLHSVVHVLGHESKKLRKEGKHGKANGLALIAFGIFLLPFPILGIPLIGVGIYMLCI
jgi:hypothetical protein